MHLQNAHYCGIHWAGGTGGSQEDWLHQAATSASFFSVTSVYLRDKVSKEVERGQLQRPLCQGYPDHSASLPTMSLTWLRGVRFPGKRSEASFLPTFPSRIPQSMSQLCNYGVVTRSGR